MIPKLAFQVRITRRLGQKLFTETHHYESLIAAATSSQVFFRKPGVRRIEVLMVIDDISVNGEIEQRATGN